MLCLCVQTTLLTALINEMGHTEGSSSVSGTVAYVSQKAWVFMGTIMDNILFGNELVEDKFWNIVHVCALRVDVDNMPQRHLTLVGEKGFKLSGGERARISLARALYADADIYLMDDLFAALDVKVAQYIRDK